MGVIIAPVLGSGSTPACTALVPNFISFKFVQLYKPAYELISFGLGIIRFGAVSVTNVQS